MFIVSPTQDLQRGSEGGTNLERYLPSLVPPSEPRRKIQG